MRSDQWIATVAYSVEVTKGMIEYVIKWEEFIELNSQAQNTILLQVADQQAEMGYVPPTVQAKTTLLNNY